LVAYANNISAIINTYTLLHVIERYARNSEMKYKFNMLDILSFPLINLYFGFRNLILMFNIFNIFA